MSNKNFIDIGYHQLNKYKKTACGDVFLSRKIKEEGRTITVMCDGTGNGIKANVLATMTASMALNFTLKNIPLLYTAEVITNALAENIEKNTSYSTFTIVNIDSDNQTNIINYCNPNFLLIRDEEVIFIPNDTIEIKKNGLDKKLYSFNFKILKGDRIIIFTKGVTKSGIGNANMLLGWGIEKIKKFILKVINKDKFISSDALSKKIVNQACNNDILKPRDDISCAVIYFREPRKLLICTGPPFDLDNDKKLASIVENFNGKKIISGGTTAQIIARELDKKINAVKNIEYSGLPPTGNIEGIGLVTEGILTLGKVSEILQKQETTDISGIGPAIEIVQNIFSNDIIEFVVGTKINNANQNPNLPIELEIRRNVVKNIIKLLENKFLKEVHLQFI